MVSIIADWRGQNLHAGGKISVVDLALLLRGILRRGNESAISLTYARFITVSLTTFILTVHFYFIPD